MTKVRLITSADGSADHANRQRVNSRVPRLERWALAVLCLFGMFLSGPAQAAMVSLQTPAGLEIEAEYLAGEQSRPLILFVHGFLQTRDFSTVKRLADALYDNGYSTLSPNLSLGVSRRQRSIACESIQMHNLQDSAREIGQWVGWAKRHGHRHIVIVGHSSGSVMVTAYLAMQPQPTVDKTILISLDYFGAGRPAAFETVTHGMRANQLAEQGSQELTEFALNFCNKYLTTPQNFLSYFNWNAHKVLAALRTSRVENHVIFGGKDKRISKQWMADLQAQFTRVHVIELANHFFDQTHEFDLLDLVEKILE